MTTPFQEEFPQAVTLFPQAVSVFRVTSDNYNEFNKGDLVRLNLDDNTEMPEFVSHDSKGALEFMLLSDVEIVEQESNKQNSNKCNECNKYKAIKKIVLYSLSENEIREFLSDWRIK